MYLVKNKKYNSLFDYEIHVTWYQSFETKKFFLQPLLFSLSQNLVLMAMESSSMKHSWNPREDASSPYFLHHSENHNSVIVTPKLTSSNFPSWKWSFLLVVSIKNKQGFLDWTIPKPSPEDFLYLPWIRCNNLIVALLLRSISPSIASTVFYVEHAKQIRNKLHQRFFELDDSRISHLHNLLCTLLLKEPNWMPISLN